MTTAESMTTTETLALADFLLARIAEDEAVAPRCGLPARWLAECEAKRRIVEARQAPEGQSELGYMDDDAFRAVEWVMQCLALPYADHPDYRQTWKP